jgi:phospholipid/cholesterol/gamma-HCH transport system ATP-binding protein
MARTRPAPVTTRLDKPPPVIEFAGVSKILGGRTILEDLTFSVLKGETFVIIGYSGTGKSVTLRHLVGLMQPDEGSIRVAGEEITTMTRKELELMRRRFGVLFQSGALIAWLSVFENVELPLKEHTKMSRRKRSEIVRQKLELVNLWQDRDKFPAEISGGMKKRAGLARAIALDPEIVLYDEPSSGLDPVIGHEIDKLIIRLRTELKLTQVVVTHDMQSAYAIADRIGMFHYGRMVQIGTPDDIRHSENPEVLHFVSGGREGQVSKRSITAILRGKAPTASARKEAEAEPDEDNDAETSPPGRVNQAQTTPEKEKP